MQARSQVLRFGGAKYILGGAMFVFIISFKQIFLETSKFGQVLPPNGPLWLRA